MYINKVKIQNFRLLKDSWIDLRKEDKQEGKNLSLLIGRNNSGKTSFIVLFEKFLKSQKINFDDFSLSLREKILNFNEDTNVHDLSIKLILQISYTQDDSLENLSDFILDLDPSINTVNLLFECSINKKKLLEKLSKIEKKKEKFIQKNIEDYLDYNIYAFDKDSDLESNDRTKLFSKDRKSVDNLINLQVIHAKRDVASSESSQQGKKVLSGLTTKYFNEDNKISHDSSNIINASIIEMDSTLDTEYAKYFKPFLESAKNFLDMHNLNVVSDLQSKEILAHHSKIVYGKDNNYLPEHLNGLGYMNILYLLLQIEIKKNDFANNSKDINLLFIEEPEAHTHPQMQYIFIDKIKDILSSVSNLQTFISTHSAHIVKKCDFMDIRYFLINSQNIEIKNFYNELKEKYKSENSEEDSIEKAHFKFLHQYLTIASSELFFAEKIIFIEGTTEKMLLPYYIEKFDKKYPGKDSERADLSSQNISILEVGANAKAFRHFLEFLGIKTLIITDIDTTKKDDSRYKACSVDEGTNISNCTIKYFLNAPKITDSEFANWMRNLKSNSLPNSYLSIKIAYQEKENDYIARSFEDAFININIEKLKENKEYIEGLKNIDELDTFSDIYTLTDKILNSKTEFASSLLFLALSSDVEWEMPKYIEEGLKWIAE